MNWPVILITLFVVVVVINILLWLWAIRRIKSPRAAEKIQAGQIVAFTDKTRCFVKVAYAEDWLAPIGIAIADAEQGESVRLIQRGTLTLDKLDLPNDIYYRGD